MKIAIFSEEDIDVSEGIDKLIEKYSEKSPTILLPVSHGKEDFYRSVFEKCAVNRVKVTVYYKNSEGLQDILIHADNGLVVCEDPEQEVLRQLGPGDAIGIVWMDELEEHAIIHSVEDLALDVWDITDGLDPIDLDDPFDEMGVDDLREGMQKAFLLAIDLMSAYIASTIMDSVGEAMLQRMTELKDKKDIKPFEDPKEE